MSHLVSITFFHGQVYVDLLVVEPARNLHPAAINPRICFLSFNDGQGNVTLHDLAQQLVPGGLSESHIPIIRQEDCVATFGSGHLPVSPAETEDSVSLDIITAGQSDILANVASDCNGAG